MTNRRRIILIVLSVGVGSLLALWVIKKRIGTLTPQSYMQLIMNFIFSIAIVIGIAILFKRSGKKEE